MLYKMLSRSLAALLSLACSAAFAAESQTPPPVAPPAMDFSNMFCAIPADDVAGAIALRPSSWV